MASNLRVDTILPSTGTNVAIGTASGTVSLIGDSNLTTSGNLTIGGNLGVGGVLTYEDVTNIDSVGLITARSGVNVSGGEVKVGTAVTVSSGGVITSGIVTATSFSGSGANLTGISGGVLQIKQNHYTARPSTSTASGAQWHPTGLDTTITPTSASSKILVNAKINVGIDVASRRIFLRVYRGSTIIGEAASAGNSVLLASSVVYCRYDDVAGDLHFNFLDSPNTTSATTYAFKLNHSQTGTATIYVNRPHSIPDRVNDAYFTSQITLTEYAGGIVS